MLFASNITSHHASHTSFGQKPRVRPEAWSLGRRPQGSNAALFDLSFPRPLSYYLAPSGLEMLTLGALSPSKITPLVQCEDHTHSSFVRTAMLSCVQISDSSETHEHEYHLRNSFRCIPRADVIDVPHRRDIGLSAYHPRAFP